MQLGDGGAVKYILALQFCDVSFNILYVTLNLL